MTYCKTLAVLIVAAINPLWVQEVSGGLIGSIFGKDDASKNKGSIFDDESIFGSRDIQIGNTYPETSGGKNFFGSRDVQIGNVYAGISGGKQVFGSEDVQTGNIYAENPQGTNKYGPTLIQKGNVYSGSDIDGKMFGAHVTQSGNTYPKTSGKGETYGPVVIQEGNVYSFKNITGNHHFGAVVNQTNNIYPKGVEDNKDALKPVIIQKGNVFLEPPGKISAAGVVNHSGNRFHPTEGHKAATGPRSEENMKVNSPLPSLGMMKRQHEEMMRIIDFHIRTDKSSSKRCANGMMDSERLDQVVSLKKEVETEVVLLKALLQINRNRKVICDSLQDQCARHDKVRKWISHMKLVLAQKTAKSRGTWMSLRTC